jgi:hypothetical protein
VGGCGLDFSLTQKRKVADSCEHSNELSASIKGKEYHDYQLNKDSVSYS